MREALASALESRGAYHGARVLDLFAGTGALGFEALSRGASSIVAVDRDLRVVQQIARSARELGVEAQVHTARLDLLGDPRRTVRKLPKAEPGFDLVFADAPYSEIGSVGPLLEALVGSELLTPGARVVVEHPASRDWSWPNGLASEADYRYGHTGISLGVYTPEKGTQ